MEKKSTRRKFLRRKYKRYAAAVAGAALISGAALHGFPTPKAFAAENPTPSPPTSLEQKTSIEPTAGKFNTRESGDKQAWYKKYHRSKHERYNDDDYYVSRDGDVTVRYLDSPVDVIKHYASIYGFDADSDTFTFLSLSSREASILVTKHNTGERFRVDLERGRHRDWNIVEVSSIGY